MSTKIHCDIFLSSQDSEALYLLTKKKDISKAEAFRRAMKLYLFVSEAQEKQLNLQLMDKNTNLKTKIIGF